MKKFKLALLAVLSIGLLAACGTKDSAKIDSKADDTEKKSDKLQVVTSYSILYDVVNQIGGDLVDVHSIIPIGTAPHEYEPLPEDNKKATDADILFYSGLNLEGSEDGWFFKLVNAVNQDKEKVFEAMKGVEPMLLKSDDGRVEEQNPHAFLSPVIGKKMAQNIMDALIKVDPDNKDGYLENGNAYLTQLDEMDQQYKDKIAEIPEDKRILVTSEHAYQYMAKEYNLKEGYIWEVDTEEIGSPAQIKKLVDFIKENDVKALFVESNVDKRPMETVSSETGVKIVDEIYSDELGSDGTDGDTYLGFLQSNIDKIHAGLMK